MSHLFEPMVVVKASGVSKAEGAVTFEAPFEHALDRLPRAKEE